MVKLSVICPIYNEEPNIPVLYERLKKVMEGMSLKNYEIIFVNDGSKDNSILLIKSLASKDKTVKYIDFSRNFGHQIAVSAGIDKARGEAVAIIDSDLQDPPELIPEMYAKHQKGYEVVYAKRKARKGESWLKLATAKIFYRLLKKLVNFSIPLDTGDFRIIDRKVVEAVKRMPEKQKFLRGQIAWIGFNQTYVEFERDERYAGKPKYTYAKLLKLALDGITSFSDVPLKIATVLGFIFSSVAFIFMIWAIVAKIFNTTVVQGWASLMISIGFLGGVQLLVLGLFGEYLGRLSENVKNRPLYIVNDTNFDAENATKSVKDHIQNG